MSVINTNVLSLVTQNNLKSSEASLNSAIQRLSSGMRINSAKDDAAGQAIANRFTANIRGLTQAQRNANDGISLAQTTEGALNQVNDNLQRIRELAVQASNGSNSGSDLKSIQDEINQRLAEIDRTSQQTDFNGVKVLSSSAKALSVQVGANDGERINIDLQEISSKTLSLTGFNVDGKGSVANAAANGDDLKLANFTKAGSPTASGAYAWTKTTSTNNVAATASTVLSKLANGATATFAGTNNVYGVAAAANYTYDSASSSFTYAANDITAAKVSSVITPAAGAASVSAKITINGTSTDVKITNTGDITTTDDKALFIDGSGNITPTTSGTTATYAKATVANLTQLMDSTDGTTTIKAADGTTDLTVGTDIGASIESAVIQMADGTTYTGNAGAGGASHIDVTGAKVSASQLLNMEASDAVNDLTFNVNVNTSGVAASTAVTVHTAAGVTTVKNGANTISMDGSAGHTGELTVDTSYSSTTTYYEQTNGNVTDGSGGRIYKDANGAFTLSDTTASQATANPLKALDSALQMVDNLRSSLGAVQNRFDSVIANLGTTVTNLTASRSRIQDADYATEVSNMSRAQILQQAGTSVLAQANQTTQGVLSLLR